MRKRIPTSQIRIGMFIDGLCGSWIDHPFWRQRFKIEDQKTLNRLRESGVSEVWIDTAKGKDTDTEAPQVAAPGSSESTAADTGSEAQPDPDAFAAELERASRICAESKAAVMEMFQDARLGKAINAATMNQLVDDISSSVMRQPLALISLARLKSADEYTYMHSVAVCAMMIALARQLELSDDDVREAGLAGLVHDVGKMKMPTEVLNKPGRLTDAEYAVIKQHPELGHSLLRANESIGEAALDVCLHHHEKFDGSGYPEGLKGTQISRFARMGAICDVYDAITSNRPYKKGWDPAESIKLMANWDGHFDERLFQAFVRSIGIYPTGSLVRLASGKLAVVVNQTPGQLLKPKVTVFFSANAHCPIPHRLVDLSQPHVHDSITGLESSAQWGFKDLDKIWLGDHPGR